MDHPTKDQDFGQFVFITSVIIMIGSFLMSLQMMLELVLSTAYGTFEISNITVSWQMLPQP